MLLLAKAGSRLRTDCASIFSAELLISIANISFENTSPLVSKFGAVQNKNLKAV